MRTTLLAALTPLALTALSSPTKLKRYEEGPSWTIRNLDYFKSSSSTLEYSSISFSFTDPTPNIQENTTCSHSGSDTTDYTTYFPCDDFVYIGGTEPYGVSFKFDGENLTVNRSYVDSTVDTPPYAQVVTAYGVAPVKFSETVPGDGGNHEIADEVVVPITSFNHPPS